MKKLQGKVFAYMKSLSFVITIQFNGLVIFFYSVSMEERAGER